MKKLAKIAIICIPLLIISGAVAFIALDAPAAADITDNFLRPIIGDKAVIALEKVFYNSADTIDRVTSHSVSAPMLNTQADNLALAQASHLNLTPLTPLPGVTPLSDEGTWHNQPLALFPNQEVMATSFIQPDPARPYAIAVIAQLDTKS